jgi:hypothetical protein
MLPQEYGIRSRLDDANQSGRRVTHIQDVNVVSPIPGDGFSSSDGI